MKLVMRQNLAHPRGFTLFELLIVLSMVTIVGFVSSTWFRHQVLRFRLEGATRTLVSDLLAARRAAITDGRKQRILFLDAHRYAIVTDTNGNGRADPGERVVTRNVHDRYPGVLVNATNHPIFHPRGTASRLATVTLTNKTGSRVVTIGITGRVSLKS